MTSFDASGLDDVPIEALRTLQRQMGDFVVVAMAAIDLILRAAAELPPQRLTRDIDLAIEANSPQVFAERTRQLLPRGDSRLQFSLDGAWVDVIPYGEVAPGHRLELEAASSM